MKFRKYVFVFLILILWQMFPVKYFLPSPFEIIRAFIIDFKNLMLHSYYTLLNAFIGIFISIVISFVISFLMDYYEFLYDAIYPLLILTQTIPTIAIAPLIILWFGYYMKSKIILIVIATFFPITISLIDAYKNIDEDRLNLFKAMGANKYILYRHLKIPSIMPSFISGLKISISYSILSAVVAEWLGGFYGLGVYMTRVRKSFELDKMFAVIFLISILSIVLMNLITRIENKLFEYRR